MAFYMSIAWPDISTLMQDIVTFLLLAKTILDVKNTSLNAQCN
jgi:hypothetical protein